MTSAGLEGTHGPGGAICGSGQRVMTSIFTRLRALLLAPTHALTLGSKSQPCPSTRRTLRAHVPALRNRSTIATPYQRGENISHYAFQHQTKSPVSCTEALQVHTCKSGCTHVLVHSRNHLAARLMRRNNISLESINLYACILSSSRICC